MHALPYLADAVITDAAGWQALIVAVVLLVVIATIMTAAIVKYPADQVVKIWGVLGTLTGVATGYFGTYFFTRPQIREAQQQAAQVQESAARAERDLSQVRMLIGRDFSAGSTTHAATGPVHGHADVERIKELIDSAHEATSAATKAGPP